MNTASLETVFAQLPQPSRDSLIHCIEHADEFNGGNLSSTAEKNLLALKRVAKLETANSSTGQYATKGERA
jgi:hypothetical protein